MHHCLLLNADTLPKSILPLSAVSWQEAIKLVYCEAAIPLHYYADWEVHSPSITMKVPAVILLTHYVRYRPYTRMTKRGALFLRDGYKCSYCLNVFPMVELTIDHVIPRSYGGGTNWKNCTTACITCNIRRGNNINIRPCHVPYQPTYHELVAKRKCYTITVPHESWVDYLGWDDRSLIRVEKYLTPIKTFR